MGETENKQQDGRLKPTISIIALNGNGVNNTKIKEIDRLGKKPPNYMLLIRNPP